MVLFPKDGYGFDGPGDFMESKYSYLCRSSRPEMEKQRQLLQSWFDDYPDEEKPEIAARIRSEDDALFDSAFYELFLHALLKRKRCDIEIHPVTQSDDNCAPDFLVTTPDQEKFYLEAKVVGDKSQEEVRRDKLTAELQDFLRTFKSYDFCIVNQVIQAPSKSIQRKKIKSFIEKMIADSGLNASKTKSVCTKLFSDEGAQIEFSLLHNPRSDRPDNVSCWGGFSSPVITVDSREKIIIAIKDKANKYKNLGLPFVIALNAQMVGLTYEELREIFFGIEGLFMGKNTYRAISMDPLKRRHTRVNSIWFSVKLSLDSLWKAKICQFINPWAENVFNIDYEEFGRSMMTESGKVDRREEKWLGQMLDIPEGWPEEGKRFLYW